MPDAGAERERERVSDGNGRGSADHADADSFSELRSLIVGPERSELKALQAHFLDPSVQTRDVSRVLPDAIALRATDPQLSKALAPSIEVAVTASVRKDPRPLADALFPAVSYGHGREFWRAYGLILAWPLNVYNVFTQEPLGWWLVIAFIQTAVAIPLSIYFFGKGAYCGWVCSCGALAETLGDSQRHKMPHGPQWNRLNLAGQVILAIAVVLLVISLVPIVTFLTRMMREDRR